jgi:EmrB/QacA subfamily drug resistance transporter
VSAAPLSGTTRRSALIVAVAFFMQLLDGAILNTSLPLMAASLHVTPLALTTSITAYLVAAAAIMPTSAWLAQRFEARRVFMFALAGFTLASVLCAVVNGLPQLVLARVLQGLAGGLMAPIGRSLVLRQCSKNELMAATAVLVWPSLLAPVVGPPLGGAISTWLGWQWNFLLNLPVGVLGLWATWRWVPRVVNTAPPKALDWVGALWCAGAMVLLLSGLEGAAHAGTAWLAWRDPVLTLAAASVVAWMALRHLRRVAHPVISLAPLRVRTFSIATLGGGTVLVSALQATPFVLPLLFQLGFGMTAVQAGFFTLIYFVGNLSMKTITTPVLRRWGFARVMRVGSVLAAASIGACALLDGSTPVALSAVVLLVAGGLRSLQMTAMNTLAYADIEPAQQGAASALHSLCGQLAAAFAAAFSSLILGLSLHSQGRTELASADFKWALAFAALLALCASAAFWRLSPQDGAEVSGHRAGDEQAARPG